MLIGASQNRCPEFRNNSVKKNKKLGTAPESKRRILVEYASRSKVGTPLVFRNRMERKLSH